MRKKEVRRELIRIGEAARILGIHKKTFYRRLLKGPYREAYKDIYVVKRREGWMADLMDVFHYAYPNASDDMISQLIYQYRADVVRRREEKSAARR